MMKLKVLNHPSGRSDMVHWCPGCNAKHAITVAGSNSSGAVWSWDGSHDAPTFSPSVNIRYFCGERVSHVCHYFLRAGRIEFLGDCTHSLRGQTVHLPEMPDEHDARS